MRSSGGFAMKSAISLDLAAESRLVLEGILLLLAGLALGALFLAEIPGTLRAVLVTAIAVVLWRSLRAVRRQPRRLFFAEDGTAWLEEGDSPRRLSLRPYGPFLVLSLTGDAGVTRLVLVRAMLGRDLERRLIARAGAN